MEKERIYGIVRAYQVGKPRDSLVSVIPRDLRKELKLKAGMRFLVKLDNSGRIIYEPLRY